MEDGSEINSVNDFEILRKFALAGFLRTTSSNALLDPPHVSCRNSRDTNSDMRKNFSTQW